MTKRPQSPLARCRAERIHAGLSACLSSWLAGWLATFHPITRKVVTFNYNPLPGKNVGKESGRIEGTICEIDGCGKVTSGRP
jgi:hypothetical protein